MVLVGWCIAQLLFNALLAALAAVLPDQVPPAQRGLVSGFLGVQLFTGNRLAMFLARCAIGGFFILLFVARLKDRRLAEADKPTWSLRELASSFYVNPRRSPDFAWAFASRFMFVLAYAFLTTYQVYYLLDRVGSAEADVPRQIFLGTLVQSVVIVAASLIGGRLSDRTGRRKVFVLTASIVYGLAMFVLAIASSFNGFLVGMAIGGLGFGVYTAVDLALVVAALLGVIEPDSALKNLAAAPEFVWELSLGIYLMVKGFRPSPITAETTAATPSPSREFAT
jgi:MFS family permease